MSIALNVEGDRRRCRALVKKLVSGEDPRRIAHGVAEPPLVFAYAVVPGREASHPIFLGMFPREVGVCRSAPAILSR